MTTKKTPLEELSKTLSKDSEIFSEHTRSNLLKLSTQLERLGDLENNPFRYLLECFPTAFAMLDHELRYLLHSQKWLETFSIKSKDLVGSLLEFSGIHIAEISLEVYRKALKGEYHTDRGKDAFLTIEKKRIHIHWMVWSYGSEKSGIFLIANLNFLP